MKLSSIDGHVKSYATNLIAENIYEQFDDVGNKYHLIDEIIDHRKDNSAMSHKTPNIPSGDAHIRKEQQEDGFCVFSGRMVQPAGSIFVT